MDDALPTTNCWAVVLDTNVALDWLLFNDGAMAALAGAIHSRSVHWVTCPRMRDEFERTLSYPSLLRWNPNCEHLLTSFDRESIMLATPTPRVTNPVCTDADDQVFIDLALAHGARWLVTRDRALLKLSRRACTLGLRIIRPVDWSMAQAHSGRVTGAARVQQGRGTQP